MIWDERVVSAIQVFIGFGITFLLVPTLWRERKNLDKRLIALWTISWAFGLGSFLNLDMGYDFVGQVSHIPNLSLLLVQSLMVAAIYSLVVLTSTTLRTASSDLKTLLRVTVLFFILQVFVFFLSGFAFADPYLARNNPSSIGELIYLDAVYVYEVVLFFRPMVLFNKMFINSCSIESRIRSGAMLAAIVAGTMYSLLRIASTVIVYCHPIAAEIISGIRIALWFSFTISLLSWPFSLIPTAWFEFFRQARQLYHLSYLYWRIHNDCGRSLGIPLPRWLTRVRQAAFYTNTIAVFILDLKWLITQNRVMLIDADLSAAIRDLDDSLPQKQFIAVCVEQSSNLRKQEKLRMRKVETASNDQAVSQAA